MWAGKESGGLQALGRPFGIEGDLSLQMGESSVSGLGGCAQLRKLRAAWCRSSRCPCLLFELSKGKNYGFQVSS